jgi:hypothetical protein
MAYYYLDVEHQDDVVLSSECAKCIINSALRKH